MAAWNPLATLTPLCLLTAALLAVSAVAADAAAQGVESSPTGVEDMLPADSDDDSRTPGWLGVMLAEDDDADGVQITRVLRGSPASAGGLQEGDRITGVDGKTVATVDEVQSRIRKRAASQDTRVLVHRDGQDQELTIALKPTPQTQQLLERQFVGHSAPEFEAKIVGEDEDRASLDELAGKPIVVDFWATWCGPCRPLSQDLGQLSDKLDDKVHFIGLTSEAEQTVEQHLARNDSRFPVATTDEDVMQSYLIESYPTVFVIDAEGKVRGVFVGLGHMDDIEKLLSKLAEPSGR
ncbi:MAG: redoxin family protein [Persicimonas sp.]